MHPEALENWGMILFKAIKIGRDTKPIKPGWLDATFVLFLSQSIEIYKFYSFSMSPWSKNSSNKRYVQSWFTLKSRVPYEMSAACNAISIKIY